MTKYLTKNKHGIKFYITDEGRVFKIVDGIEIDVKCELNGYLYALIPVLDKNGKYAYKNIAIHRLVAEAFIPNPNNYNQVNHKDENKHNNSVDNLEWCTQLYNIRYSNLLHKNDENWRKWNPESIKRREDLKLARLDKLNLEREHHRKNKLEAKEQKRLDKLSAKQAKEQAKEQKRLDKLSAKQAKEQAKEQKRLDKLSAKLVERINIWEKHLDALKNDIIVISYHQDKIEKIEKKLFDLKRNLAVVNNIKENKKNELQINT